MNVNDQTAIQEDMLSYRQLIEERRGINKKANKVKMRIYNHVFENGDYEDEDGFARKRQRPAQYRVKEAKLLFEIANSWAKSEDPILKSCGEIVIANMERKESQEFVAIK